MHAVVCDLFDLGRQESADSNVKSHVGVRYSGEQFRSEMQAGRRSCDRARALGKNGLIADLVLSVGGAMKIGRNGDAAETLQIGLRVEFHYA